MLTIGYWSDKFWKIPKQWTRFLKVQKSADNGLQNKSSWLPVLQKYGHDHLFIAYGY